MRRIACITGSRADGCPLTPVIEALGKSAHRIKTSGLYGHEGTLLSILRQQKPDIVCLLGDRYETLVAASVASLLCIPIAHIHGGDVTVGAVDDAFRNAITKLAYWHFPACQLHAERIQAMGEPSERVFVCGAPGVDALAMSFMTRKECETELGINLKPPIALICYHPETLGSKTQPILDIYSELNRNNYETIIISGANKDSGGKEINDFWRAQIEHGHKKNILFKKTFSQKLWLSLMRHADVLIGNSSSFIFEGMTLGKKFINIGTRQKGRYEEAIALFAREQYPFSEPGTVAKKIAERLLSIGIPISPVKYAGT